MRFARVVFLLAGAFGLLLLVPLAYSAIVATQTTGPGLGGPGLFFLGFVLQYVCWQVLYLVLASDPVRFRPIMIPALFSQVIGVLNPQWLYLYGFAPWIPVTVVEGALAILFLVAYIATGRTRVSGAA